MWILMTGVMSPLLRQTNCGVLDGFAPLLNETCPADMVFGLAKIWTWKLGWFVRHNGVLFRCLTFHPGGKIWRKELSPPSVSISPVPIIDVGISAPMQKPNSESVRLRPQQNSVETQLGKGTCGTLWRLWGWKPTQFAPTILMEPDAMFYGIIWLETAEYWISYMFQRSISMHLPVLKISCAKLHATAKTNHEELKCW